MLNLQMSIEDRYLKTRVVSVEEEFCSNNNKKKQHLPPSTPRWKWYANSYSGDRPVSGSGLIAVSRNIPKTWPDEPSSKIKF